MGRGAGRGVILLVVLLPITSFGEEPASAPRMSSRQSAELQEELLYLSEETVSIAARYDQPISEAPSNVYVITDEDIRQSGAPDWPTVLRRIPGLEVMQVTGADFNVSVRGDNQLNANKLLVMVDGRSIYTDVQGTVYWKAIPVTLPEIKRIEVLKGPASVLYGFNAFDGIVNIITKSPEEMKGTTLQFGGGAYGTISSAAIHAGTAGKLGYRLSVGHDQNQQWRKGNALAFRDNKFNVQTEYALPGDSKLSLSGGLVDTNRFDGVVTAAVSHLSQRPEQGYAHAVYERSNFVVRAFWNGYDEHGDVATTPVLAPFLRLTDKNGSSTIRIASNTYNVEAQHRLELGSGNRFTYGVNYRHNASSSNFLSGFTREDRLGLYAQDEWRPTQAWSATAGVRYDLDTFIRPTISPRVALLYSPTQDHTFRATVAVGYRPPTAFEFNLDSLVVTTLPPPGQSSSFNLRGANLDPERIISYEVGYQGWYLQHRVRLRADMFYNHLSDLITFTPVPLNDSGRAHIYGGEAGAEFLATRWLSGFANLSYQEIDQTFAGEQRRGAPRFKANAGLRGQWENGLTGEIAYHYVGATTYPLSRAFQDFAPLGVVPPNSRVGSYNLLNLRGGYKFWQQKAAAGFMREAEVAVSAFNALNDTHKEHPLGDTIGSRVMGWVTVRF